MPYGQLIFWFITYTAVIAGTAISAHAAFRYRGRPFLILFLTETSLLIMVLSVSLIISAYYLNAIEAESLYYLIFQVAFFLGITASTLSLLFIPSAIFPCTPGRRVPHSLVIPVISLFILYTVTLVLKEGYVSWSSHLTLINGVFQLFLFLFFMTSSLYSLVSLLFSWQTRYRYVKAILFSIGFIMIVAVFFIDILYGLWSKHHYNRELSIFHVLPAYALIVSVLLTILVMKLTGQKNRESIDPLLLKSYGISPREEEVIRLLVDGNEYKSIAEKLYISLATIQTHVKNIYRKTGVNSKIELVNLLRSNRKNS